MDKLKQQRVLVTGGAGYLGSKLITRLIELDCIVCSLDRRLQIYDSPMVISKACDLSNHELLKEVITDFKPKFIYHLAAKIDRTRDFNTLNEFVNANLLGTANLLNALDYVPYEMFFYISTSEIYGGEQVQSPFNEEGHFIPVSPYSLSKYFGELVIKTHSNLSNTNYLILRLFNFLGPDLPSTFFPSLLKEKLANDEPVKMTLGEQKRDFLHLNDVLEALLIASNSSYNGKTYNICSGKGVSIRQLANEAKKIMKSNSIIEFGAIPYRDNEIWEMVGDNSKFKKDFGWEPKYDILDFFRP